MTTLRPLPDPGLPWSNIGSGRPLQPFAEYMQQIDRAVRNYPSFSVHRNGTDQTAIVNATFTKVQFTTEEFDTNANFDNATNYRFTPSVAGKYLITFNLAFASIADGKIVLAAIYKNGSAYKYGIPAPFGATGAGGAGLSLVVDFNGTTDYVEFFAYHEHGSNRDLSGQAVHTFATGIRVSS